ncbi:MAG: NAD(P)H-dependent oxidoreductase, partial [Archaeoglobaceae archaeon]|nr:NAD(P)H-dependent oxidoreductase [Archaeoglobaceae archaeon]
KPEELANYDAIIFGAPTRFGVMSAQMKQFIDMTGRLWMERKLEGKIGAVFTSNEMPHGGKEATLLSMILPLLGHGMIVVGLPPVKELFKAGSYYGATSTGEPKSEDLEVAKMLGRRVAEVAKKLFS